MKATLQALSLFSIPLQYIRVVPISGHPWPHSEEKNTCFRRNIISLEGIEAQTELFATVVAEINGEIDHIPIVVGYQRSLRPLLWWLL